MSLCAHDIKNNGLTSADILDRLRSNVVGLDVNYQLADGRSTRRRYLDNAATTLPLKLVNDVLDKYQPFVSNTHTDAHFGAKLTTREFDWAHRVVLEFVRADPHTYTAFFVGSGTTGGINRVARTLRAARPNRDVVITTIMEHHSNDLPHRKHFSEVIHIPSHRSGKGLGSVDLGQIEQALRRHAGRVNYLAISGVSNVTGIVNPIHEIASMAHAYDALILVDAAQMAAHMPINMCEHADATEHIDLLVFSGHKVYAPGSPGVVIARKELLTGVAPVEVGGGMVEDVFINREVLTQRLPDRQETGTPNICGAIALGSVLYSLTMVGMENIEREERELTQCALDRLGTIDGLSIYGENAIGCKRVGTLAFNIHGMDHSLTAAILNDYFNISVRNGCFCAHPYVRELLTEHFGENAEGLSDKELEDMIALHRGMVRVSFGIYNTEQDVDALAEALSEIINDRGRYATNYERHPDGDYRHKTFRFDPGRYFSTKSAVEAWLEAAGVA